MKYIDRVRCFVKMGNGREFFTIRAVDNSSIKYLWLISS